MGKVDTRYFRLSGADKLTWDGKNLDATQEGIKTFNIRRPADDQIAVEEADKAITGGYYTIDHLSDFRLAIQQQSKVEAGANIASRLTGIPGMLTGGGATAVATELASIVRSVIAGIDISASGTATANVYRTAEDGGGAIYALATGTSELRADVDTAGLGGLTFKATAAISSPRSVKRPPGGASPGQGSTPANFEQEVTVSTGSVRKNIGDATFIKIGTVAATPVSYTVTLNATVDPVAPDLNRLLEEIRSRLRQFALVTPVDPSQLSDPAQDKEKVATPTRQSGESEANFLQRVFQFGEKLVAAFQAVLNAILDSVKRRVVGALITTTRIQIDTDVVVPDGVKQSLASLNHVPGSPIEEPGSDATVLIASATDVENGAAIDDNFASQPITFSFTENRPLTASGVEVFRNAINTAVNVTTPSTTNNPVLSRLTTLG